MSVVYSLVNGVVKATITVPEKQEVRDLGLLPTVLVELEQERISYTNTIATYQQKLADLEAKIALIAGL